MPPDEAVHSGFNAKWVNSLTDMPAEACNEYMANLADMPLKSCDATVGCKETVEYWAWFHGCDSLAICKRHLESVVYEVNTNIARGASSCNTCGKPYGYLGAVMKWRVI